MAIMATEEPQTLPIEQKAKAPEDVKDMAVDEPSVPAVNGYAPLPPFVCDELKHLMILFPYI